MVEYIIPAFGSTRPWTSDHWHLDEMVIVTRPETLLASVRPWTLRTKIWASSSKAGAMPKPLES